jgi:hypothetical protein
LNSVWSAPAVPPVNCTTANSHAVVVVLYISICRINPVTDAVDSNAATGRTLVPAPAVVSPHEYRAI